MQEQHTWRVVMAVRVLAAIAVPVYGQLGAALARDIVASRAALVDIIISTLAENGAQDPPAAAITAAAALVPVAVSVQLAVLVAGFVDDQRRDCLRGQVDAVRTARVCGHHCVPRETRDVSRKCCTGLLPERLEWPCWQV